MASVIDLYSSLQGKRVRESGRVTERRRETEREREKSSKTRGDYASTIREQCYVSEPIGTKYSNFDC